MFSALQSPSGSERSMSSAGVSLKSADSAVSVDDVPEVSSKEIEEEQTPQEQEHEEQQPALIDSLDTDTFDGGVRVVMNLQDDDTVGITLTGDVTGSLPGLADLVQDDELCENPRTDPLPSKDEATENHTTNPMPTDTLDTVPGDTLDVLRNVNEAEGGDTTNLFADPTTEEIDMDVTGKLPNLSSLVDLDEAQDEVGAGNEAAMPPVVDGLDSPELLSAVNNISDGDATMDLTENITMNLPGLSNLVEEDEDLGAEDVHQEGGSGTPVNGFASIVGRSEVGSSTKKQVDEAVQPDTLTTDTLENDQKERWGFEPGAVDTLEMDLTQNGANVMGDRTFHAVFRPSMGPNTMTSMPDINEENQAVEQSAEQVEEEANVLTFQEFLQEADVQFLDFLRRGTSFGAANLVDNFEEPKGLMECMELLYLTSPELGFLEKGCAILQGDVHQRKFQLADKERHLSSRENQPAIFDAIQDATGDKLVNLKFDVQQLKRCCRQQTSQAWKEWRSKLEGRALTEMLKVKDVLEQDLGNLRENKRHLQDMFSESRSLAEHVDQQVENLVKEANALKSSEEECTALTRECEAVQGRCGELDEMYTTSTSKLSELTATREALQQELKSLEDQMQKKKSQLDAKEGSAGACNDGCSSSRVEVSELMCEWDMMVSLAGGESALEIAKQSMEASGQMHMSELQSILRQSVISEFYRRETDRCMQSNLGNVLVERADGDVIQLSVMDPSKGIKVSLTVTGIPQGQPCIRLNRDLCVGPSDVMQKVSGLVSHQKGFVPLTKLVANVLGSL